MKTEMSRASWPKYNVCREHVTLFDKLDSHLQCWPFPARVASQALASAFVTRYYTEIYSFNARLC